MRITIKGADFSGLGLGNVLPSNQYAETGGITDEVYVGKLKSFYEALVNAGIWSKLQVLKLYTNGTTVADGLNFKDIDTYSGSFSNDSALNHTSLGLLTGINGNTFERVDFNLTAEQFGNSHWHVFNNMDGGDRALVTSELYQPSCVLMGRKVGTSATSQSYRVKFENTISPDSANFPITETGLATLHNDSENGLAKVYSKGVLAVSSAGGNNLNPFLNTINIGANKSWGSSGYTYPVSRIPFFAMGLGEWSLQNDSDLNTIVSNFLDSL